MRILLAALVVMGGLHLIVARSIHDWDNIKPKPYAMDPYWVNFEDIFIDEYGYDSPETLEKLGPTLFHKYFPSNTESSLTTIQSERSSEEKVIHDDDDEDNHRTGSIIINDNDGLGAIISMFVMNESNDKKNKANIESDESSDEKVIPDDDDDDDDNDVRDSAEQDNDEINKIFGNNEYEAEFTQFLKGFYPDENALEEDYFAVTTSPKADTEDQKKLIENDKVMTDKQIDDILSMFFGVSSSDEKTEVKDETNENTENNYNEDHDNENRQTIDVDVNDNTENINNNANDIYTEMYRNLLDLEYKKLYKNTDQTNYDKYFTDFPHMLSLMYGSSQLNDDDNENKENNENPTNDDDDKSKVVRNENVNDDESQEFNNHDDVIYLTVTINVDKPKTVPDQENDNIASIFDIFYQTLHKQSNNNNNNNNNNNSNNNNNNNNNEYENTNENPKDFYEIINNKDQDQVWNFKPLVSEKQETDKSFSSFDNSNNMEPHFFYQTLDESRNNNNNEYENPKDFYEIINNKDQDFKPLVSDNQETSKTVSSLDSSKMEPDFIYQKLYKPNNNNNNLKYENEESSSFS